LAFRGIDNFAVYRHAANEPSRYVDYTGCGNTVNVQHPQVLRLMMDSLRYWATEMHVDGFRFDLASCLTRGTHRVNLRGKFMSAIHQDPILRNVKLIAEPWDLGEGGYQVGQFPPPWSEWNGKFRDSIRDFWRGHGENPGELMARFTGSADLYASHGHRPRASINFVTAHDGFTLRDLVSYNQKHNQANGEENRDGESYNRSWNSGVEGPTEDLSVNTLRDRRQRSLLATLLLAQGIPMLTAGDEVGRSQSGNNNPYCQDNEISWFDWHAWDGELLQFVKKILTLRREQPTLRRSAYRAASFDDLRWFSADGNAIDISHWHGKIPFVVAIFFDGHECTTNDRGELLSGDSFLVAFNGTHESVELSIPPGLGLWLWHTELDTTAVTNVEPSVATGSRITLAGYSLRVLRRERLRP
jgi:glycogen operon protein